MSLNIADVYRDVKEGLLLLDAGNDLDEVAWKVKDDFANHGGRHALGALYALHGATHTAGAKWVSPDD